MQNKIIFSALSLLLLTIGATAQKNDKKHQDREAIKSMIGCYKVSFDFAETFSSDTAYKYHDRYHSWGIEYVFIVNDQPDFIQLQHLLIVNDSTIIKHWRQDWSYEDTQLLSYDRNGTWLMTSAKPDEVKGTWTQKVYQVDDSPRYESRGTWVHVDGKNYWEGTGDAPLPRREFTKRSDYNVMKRHSRMELASDGWFLEQDNEKILRTDSGDQVLCHEKGMERFTTGDYNCQPAINWWEANKVYWEGVRQAWTEVYNTHKVLTLKKRVDEKLLWERLFEAGDSAPDSPAQSKKIAKDIIDQYITT